jgi:hypothetical protein
VLACSGRASMWASNLLTLPDGWTWIWKPCIWYVSVILFYIANSILVFREEALTGLPLCWAHPCHLRQGP